MICKDAFAQAPYKILIPKERRRGQIRGSLTRVQRRKRQDTRDDGGEGRETVSIRNS